MSTPHHKISYAQAYEDLVLAGILKGVGHGFYVDVGANHPVNDSVTKIFYDKGWSGLNIEPSAALHALLVAERPRDTNLALGLSSQAGRLAFRHYAEVDGHSTFSRDTKRHLQGLPSGAHYVDSEVPVSSLSAVLQAHRPTGDIHFLKVDVEGLELEVLLGNDWKRFRPWVLCIERNLDAARQQAIVAFLSAHGYEPVFFDGINDFVIATERQDLWANFSYAGDVVFNGVPVNRIFVPRPRPLDELMALERQAPEDYAYATLSHRTTDPSGSAFYLRDQVQPRRDARPCFMEAHRHATVGFDGIIEFTFAEEQMRNWSECFYTGDVTMDVGQAGCIFGRSLVELPPAGTKRLRP